MEVTLRIDGTDRTLGSEELQDMLAGAGRDFDVTWWPTNKHYRERSEDGSQFTSQTIADVKRVTITETAVTVLCAGRAKILLTEVVKALYIRAGDERSSSESIHLLGRKYNDYGKGGRPV